MAIEEYWNKDFLKWFKENTPKEGLSENTTFSKQFVYDAYVQGRVDEDNSNKECCKKLAEEYRQRYNEDKTDKLALNMFYHNVIAYNDFENVLAMIEDRNSMMLCFAEPPILTEKTVEVDINRIAELEQKISVLLSCKNCPENKGGYICEKEYENKCLAQKIQYIKELQEEIKNLKKTYRKQRNKRIDDLQKENAELKKQLEMSNKVYNDNLDYSHHIEEQLTKAENLIKKMLYEYLRLCVIKKETIAEAKQFLKE